MMKVAPFLVLYLLLSLLCTLICAGALLKFSLLISPSLSPFYFQSYAWSEKRGGRL
jgi:hypothetical protein